jgi:hypothetical protein
MSPPKTVYAGMIGAALLLAVFFRFKEQQATPITTEQQVRDENRQRIERIRETLSTVETSQAESAAALADMRATLQQRECEHLLDKVPDYARCIGVEVIEWCDLSEADRAGLRLTGAKGRPCP